MQAKRGGVDGDVGARFEDDRDEPDGDAAPDDLQAVRALPGFGDFADGVGEFRHVFAGDGNRLEPAVVEPEPIGQRRREAFGLRGGEVLGVGRQDGGLSGPEGLRRGAQGLVADRRRR